MKGAERNKQLAVLITDLLQTMDQYRQYEKTPAAKDIFERMVQTAREIKRLVGEPTEP